MTEEHPITPPPKLVHQWINEATEPFYVPTQAARWGADAELEACCTHMHDWGNIHHSCGLDLSNFLRTARRPKPPSLKEQALALIDHDPENQPFLSEKGIAIIRQALESLPD